MNPVDRSRESRRFALYMNDLRIKSSHSSISIYFLGDPPIINHRKDIPLHACGILRLGFLLRFRLGEQEPTEALLMRPRHRLWEIQGADDRRRDVILDEEPTVTVNRALGLAPPLVILPSHRCASGTHRQAIDILTPVEYDLRQLCLLLGQFRYDREMRRCLGLDFPAVLLLQEVEDGHTLLGPGYRDA